jgi:hypothetical protein
MAITEFVTVNRREHLQYANSCRNFIEITEFVTVNWREHFQYANGCRNFLAITEFVTVNWREHLQYANGCRDFLATTEFVTVKSPPQYTDGSRNYLFRILAPVFLMPDVNSFFRPLLQHAASFFFSWESACLNLPSQKSEPSDGYDTARRRGHSNGSTEV